MRLGRCRPRNQSKLRPCRTCALFGCGSADSRSPSSTGIFQTRSNRRSHQRAPAPKGFPTRDQSKRVLWTLAVTSLRNSRNSSRRRGEFAIRTGSAEDSLEINPVSHEPVPKNSLRISEYSISSVCIQAATLGGGHAVSQPLKSATVNHELHRPHRPILPPERSLICVNSMDRATYTVHDRKWHKKTGVQR
jgi:hypothetical protein